MTGTAYSHRLRSVRTATGRVSPESVCVALIAGAALCVYAFYRQRHVGGCDAGAYWSESLLLRGRDPGQIGALSPLQHPALVPLCHELAGDRVVGIFPLGYPALLAVFGVVGAENLVNPILGALSIWLLYLAVVPIAGRRIGGALALLWCVNPLVVWASGRVMSDAASATGLLAAFVLLSRARLTWAGVVFGASVAMRPSNLLFAVPALMWTSGLLGPSEFGEPDADRARRPGRFWLAAGLLVLLWMAIEWLVRRSPLPAAYLRGNLTNLGVAHVGRQLAFLSLVAWQMLWPVLVLGAAGAALRFRQTAPIVAWVVLPSLFYALWRYDFVVWWQLRFLLPAFPAFFLLAAYGAAALTPSDRAGWTSARVVTLAIVVFLLIPIPWAAARSFEELSMRRDEDHYFTDSRRIADSVPAGSLIGAVNLSFPLRLYGGLESFDFRQDSAPALVDAAIAEGRAVYAAFEPDQMDDRFPALQHLHARYRFIDIAPLVWPATGLQRLVVEERRLDGRPWTVRLSAAQRMVGEIGLASDGASPPPGSAWDAPGTVRFADLSAGLTFVVPAERVVAVSVVLDGNDQYDLAASPDGSSFAPLATIPIVPRPGLQVRVMTIPRGRGPVFHLTPRAGDGMYSVAEITPIVEAAASARGVADRRVRP